MNWFKHCTKKCNTAPHICDCNFMPGRAVFLTDEQRLQHEKDYRKGKTNWSSPFEPWVIETWQHASMTNGWDKAAQAVRQRLTAPSNKNKP